MTQHVKIYLDILPTEPKSSNHRLLHHLHTTMASRRASNEFDMAESSSNNSQASYRPQSSKMGSPRVQTSRIERSSSIEEEIVVQTRRASSEAEEVQRDDTIEEEEEYEGDENEGTEYEESEVEFGNPEDEVEEVLASQREPFQPNDVSQELREDNVFTDALAKDTTSLCWALWHQEKTGQPPKVRGADKNQFLDTCEEILWSTPNLILQRIIGSDIARAYKRGQSTDDRRLQGLLDRNWWHAKNPSIYLQVLVDQVSGNSPTPNELKEIIQELRTYQDPGSESDDLARSVDGAVKNIGSVSLGRYRPRQYLTTAKMGTSARRQILLDFCRALEERLQGVPANKQDQPWGYELAEVGYAKDSRARLDQHRHHESSNWLMNLFESVCFVRYGRQRFRMEQFVIYFIWAPEQASIAEIIFTRLCNAYANEGGGFTYYRPGIQHASALNLNWKTCVKLRQWAIECTPLEFNKNRAAQLAEERSRKKNELEELKSASRKTSEQEWRRLQQCQGKMELKELMMQDPSSD